MGGFLRVFFFVNIFLWCVLFTSWLGWIALMGFGGPVGFRGAFILAVTAVLLEVQGIIRWRRRWRIRVSS